jgi:hypothetical protein
MNLQPTKARCVFGGIRAMSSLVDGRAQMKGAPSLRPFRVGRRGGTVRFFAVCLQLLHAAAEARSSSVSSVTLAKTRG